MPAGSGLRYLIDDRRVFGHMLDDLFVTGDKIAPIREPSVFQWLWPGTLLKAVAVASNRQQAEGIIREAWPDDAAAILANDPVLVMTSPAAMIVQLGLDKVI